MQNPRTPDVGVKGALESLGGDNSNAHVPHAGLSFKLAVASALDCVADALLFQARHGEAKQLAHQIPDIAANVPEFRPRRRWNAAMPSYLPDYAALVPQGLPALARPLQRKPQLPVRRFLQEEDGIEH